MRGKDLVLITPTKIKTPFVLDRVFMFSGIAGAILVWFLWHFLFDLVLQVVLALFGIRLWLKNIHLKRQVNKLKGLILLE